MGPRSGSLGKSRENDDNQDPQKSVLFEACLTFGAWGSNQDPKSQSASYQEMPWPSMVIMVLKTFKKQVLNHLLRNLALTQKAKYDLKSIFEKWVLVRVHPCTKNRDFMSKSSCTNIATSYCKNNELLKRAVECHCKEIQKRVIIT